MKLQPRITFRHMERSEALEANILEHVAELDQFCADIMHCDIVVEEDHRHHHQGNLFHVRIDITVPGAEVVVSREAHDAQAHEDAYVAVRDAFNAARRKLEDYVRKRQHHVKRHTGNPQGFISELEPALDYGRIGTDEGRDIYFHRNSVINAKFESLKVGTPVQFVEEQGDEGPQASTVKVIG